MLYTTKVVGTRYTAQIKYDSGTDSFVLQLVIDGVAEETETLRNQTKRGVIEALQTVLQRTQINVNDFQLDMMAKELYEKVSGDEDSKQHNADMAEIREKTEEMANTQASLVSEYKGTFGVSQPAPEVKKSKSKTPSAREIDAAKQKQQQPEMQNLVSEINKNLGIRNPPVSNFQTSVNNPALINQSEPIDTRVISEEVQGLINELQVTRQQLHEDIQRVSLRMEKIDAIINKISSIGSKL